MEEAQGFLSVGVGETSATNVRSLSMFYHDAKHVSRGTKPHTICSSYSFAILKPQVFSGSDSNWGFHGDSDVEAIKKARVTRASTKGKGKRPSGSTVPSVSLDGVSFHTKECASLWKFIVKKNIVNEKELSVCTQ
ncbi:uncharacterized protein E5676_scaffold94G001040 [Cucumis melo var. makuwa]|uniref:Uncharacterized protein n=1 Tax=Cucumis melo var. makuwa TaxID=1194695 RepID=A0A5D3D0J7_CUCMM|nr:uncharacterized protein E6C27_scaffold163G00790 [Cucumis melo var. makuwa]TYK15979.1 uncharacterized protein E5676_scaffold94G001040 [Cucumis melo var. makuwa]